VIVAAFLANAGVAAAKFTGYAFTGSASLLAESVHSVADSGNQLLLILGGFRARLEASPEHPFGYARERYFWAFVVAVVLFTLGSLYAIVEGWEKLQHPSQLESPAWAIGILLFAMAVEGTALRTAVVEARVLRGEESWWSFIRRSKSPEIPVVLLEDFGALVGLTLALGCVGLALWTGDPRWDAVGSLAIGLLLGVIAAVMGIEMKSLLIGESASRSQALAIHSRIESHPLVRRLIHMRTQHLGPDELLVGAKVEFNPALSVEELAQAIDEIESTLRAATSADVIYIEPDLHTAE
jgi:cation diffusion facilitator family transporter